MGGCLVRFHGRERLFPVGFPDHGKEIRETRPERIRFMLADIDLTKSRSNEPALLTSGGFISPGGEAPPTEVPSE
jgi:hypothetical protein